MFAVCRALFAAIWEDGRDATDATTLQEVLEPVVGARESSSIAERITDPAIKEVLRANTSEALARGVYGVPTFEAAGELFWGQDRMSFVGRKLAGSLPPVSPALLAMLARPIAAGRRGAPTTPSRQEQE